MQVLNNQQRCAFGCASVSVHFLYQEAYTSIFTYLCYKRKFFTASYENTTCLAAILIQWLQVMQNKYTDKGY